MRFGLWIKTSSLKELHYGTMNVTKAKPKAQTRLTQIPNLTVWRRKKHVLFWAQILFIYLYYSFTDNFSALRKNYKTHEKEKL